MLRLRLLRPATSFARRNAWRNLTSAKQLVNHYPHDLALVRQNEESDNLFRKSPNGQSVRCVATPNIPRIYGLSLSKQKRVVCYHKVKKANSLPSRAVPTLGFSELSSLTTKNDYKHTRNRKYSHKKSDSGDLLREHLQHLSFKVQVFFSTHG